MRSVLGAVLVCWLVEWIHQFSAVTHSAGSESVGLAKRLQYATSDRYDFLTVEFCCYLQLFSLSKYCSVIFPDEASPIWNSIMHLKCRLSDIIQPDFGLLDQLLRLGVLTRRQVADIRSERTVYRRNDALLDLLTSEEQCDNFLTALHHTNQQHVINFIRENGGQWDDFIARWRSMCDIA